MRHGLGNYIIAVVAVISLLFLVGFAPRAASSLDRAAALFRDKSYAESYMLAQSASESPQRTFIMGMAAYRSARYAEALPLLADAEQKLPLLADYAALYQAETLLRLNRFAEAAVKAGALPASYPASHLVRRAEKLYIDIFLAAGDFRGALKYCQPFIERYPSGSDSVEVLFQSARCREATGDKVGAALIYRTIWLNNPLSVQAKRSQERLRELDTSGVKVPSYSADELLRRASTLYAQNEFSQSLQTLQSIPQEGQPAAVRDRIELRSGMAQYRMRSWKAAEKTLTRAAGSSSPAIRSEARFWQAKALERQEFNDKAFSLYMQLAGEGKQQPLADDALFEAGGLRRGQARYREAAGLFEQLVRNFPESKLVSRAAWDGAWCRYLAGEYAVAAEAFKAVTKDENQRERALYWLARSLENSGKDAGGYYRMLLDEYPFGFYAAWFREQKGIRDTRESLGQQAVVIDAPVPAGMEKPRLLASLGMAEEARSEMLAVRKKLGDKKGQFPGIAKVYLEMGEYAQAIVLFYQNRPHVWDKRSLPLWTAGYPLVYSGIVSQHAAAQRMPESLVYALIRSESNFTPAIKSSAGAIGLMQLMPATAKATAGEKRAFDPSTLVNPAYNIKLGTRHFRDLLKVYDGDVIYSVAAYNAGAGAVDRWRRNLKGLKKDEFIESIPYQETRDYVKKVYATAAIYRQLYGVR